MIKIWNPITSYFLLTLPFIQLISTVYRHCEAHGNLKTTVLVGFSLKRILRDQEDRRAGRPSCRSNWDVPLPLPGDQRHHFAFTKLPSPLGFVESALSSWLWPRQGLTLQVLDTDLPLSLPCRHTVRHKQGGNCSSCHSDRRWRES